MKYNNQKGVTLVMILMILVVGSVLLTSLFVIAQSHINTVSREEANIRAFYNADSGVEFFKANFNDLELGNISTGEEKYLFSSDEGSLELRDSEYFFDDSILAFNNTKINFSIKIEKENPELFYITSTGKYKGNNREYKEKINFNLSSNKESFEKVFNIEGTEDVLQGNTPDLSDDFLNFSETLSIEWNDWEDLRNEAVDLDEIETDSEGIYEGIIKNDGNLSEREYHFKNSIIFFDGDLAINEDVTFDNSIILINGNFHMRGNPKLDLINSIFFIYNTNRVQLSGRMNDYIIPDLDFDKLPFAFQENRGDIIVDNIENWNHSR